MTQKTQRPAGGGPKANQYRRNNTIDDTAPRTDAQDARPFRVVVRSGAKAGEWGSYPSVEQATEIAARLRRHGMDARVVEATI